MSNNNESPELAGWFLRGVRERYSEAPTAWNQYTVIGIQAALASVRTVKERAEFAKKSMPQAPADWINLQGLRGEGFGAFWRVEVSARNAAEVIAEMNRVEAELLRGLAIHRPRRVRKKALVSNPTLVLVCSVILSALLGFV